MFRAGPQPRTQQCLPGGVPVTPGRRRGALNAASTNSAPSLSLPREDAEVAGGAQFTDAAVGERKLGVSARRCCGSGCRGPLPSGPRARESRQG